MSEIVEVNIPQLAAAGLGCTNCGACGGQKARIDEILVSNGEWVDEGTVLITLETNKAVLEVEAPCSGEVAAILVDAGEPVDDGQLFLLLDSP